MTKENAKYYLPLVQALADGKTIQCKGWNRWLDYDPNEPVEFDDKPENYRIKPEPKLRPWKPEEVPVGALISGLPDRRTAMMIVELLSERVVICRFGTLQKITFNELSGFYYSLDHGKTWQPCGVMEDAA